MVAAAPPSPTLLARMSELNLKVVHVCGLTETYGPITVSPEQEGCDELPAAERARHLARQGQGYGSAVWCVLPPGRCATSPGTGRRWARS
jgi:hypothetical protein